jgi:hypothetical protein
MFHYFDFLFLFINGNLTVAPAARSFVHILAIISKFTFSEISSFLQLNPLGTHRGPIFQFQAVGFWTRGHNLHNRVPRGFVLELSQIVTQLDGHVALGSKRF